MPKPLHVGEEGKEKRIGGSGGQFGYGTINPSAALEFNLFSYIGAGINYTTGGAVSSTFNSPGSVSIGDPLQVTLSYNGSSSFQHFDS